MRDEEYLAQANLTATGEPSESTTQNEGTQAPTDGNPEAAPTSGQPITASDFYRYYDGGKENKLPGSAEFVYTHGGKVVREPISKLINKLRQVDHFDDKYKKLNEEKTAWESQRSTYEQAKAFYDKYGAFQEWSEKNPDQWQKLWELYQNKDKVLLQSQLAGGETQPNGLPIEPLANEIGSLKQQIQQLMADRQASQEEQQRAQEHADMEAVKGEIESFKKEFPEINLDETDPDGVKLWVQIVNYGVQNKIPDFESAALKFLKPRMFDVVASRARQEAVKGVKAENRAGIVAKSTKPFQNGQSTPMVNVKNQSWGDLTEMAKREYERLSQQSA